MAAGGWRPGASAAGAQPGIMQCWAGRELQSRPAAPRGDIERVVSRVGHRCPRLLAARSAAFHAPTPHPMLFLRNSLMPLTVALF